MKNYKIIYHIGKSIGLRTIVNKGILTEEKGNIFIISNRDRIALSKIHSCELIKLNGLGTMIKIAIDDNTIFLTAYKIFINKGTGFAIINYFGTRNIRSILIGSLL